MLIIASILIIFALVTLLIVHIYTRKNKKINSIQLRIQRAAGKRSNNISKTGTESIINREYMLKQSIDGKYLVSHFTSIFIWIDRSLKISNINLSTKQFVVCQIIFSTFIYISIYFMYDFKKVVFYVIPFIIGFGLPLIFLYQRKVKQIKKFQQLFPDTLDLIVRSVRSGFPVSEAIRLIGTEVDDPIATLFREVAANLSIGLSLDEALSMLQERVPISEVKFFAVSLAIQHETGGNLSEILSNLSNIMRRRFQMEKKIKALSSEAIASSFIIASLPFIVGSLIFLLNKNYIMILFTDSTGFIFLCAAITSMVFGAIVMKMMIRLDI